MVSERKEEEAWQSDLEDIADGEAFALAFHCSAFDMHRFPQDAYQKYCQLFD